MKAWKVGLGWRVQAKGFMGAALCEPQEARGGVLESHEYNGGPGISDAPGGPSRPSTGAPWMS